MTLVCSFIKEESEFSEPNVVQSGRKFSQVWTIKRTLAGVSHFPYGCWLPHVFGDRLYSSSGSSLSLLQKKKPQKCQWLMRVSEQIVNTWWNHIISWFLHLHSSFRNHRPGSSVCVRRTERKKFLHIIFFFLCCTNVRTFCPGFASVNTIHICQKIKNKYILCTARLRSSNGCFLFFFKSLKIELVENGNLKRDGYNNLQS